MSDDDEDFAAMFAESERGKKTKRPRVGDVVQGRVITIGKEAVFVDLGGKAEGQLDRDQVSDADGNLRVKVGDVIEARVASDAGGVLTLRTKLGRGPEARAELAQAQELGIPVEGLVTEVIKGGVAVDVAGVRGFCPASQIDTRFVEDLAPYVGQRLTFRITRYEPRKPERGRAADDGRAADGAREARPRGVRASDNLVLSRRALLEEEKERLATETRKKLVPGVVLRGKVVGFKPYGAFVDLGGVEGMLHVSELGFTRVERPEDVLHLGQELDVAVLEIKPAERAGKGGERAGDKGDKGERVSLSLKALASDPWQDATARLSEGARVKGTVTRLQPFGAFVEIAPGVEGLVHISELGAGRRINHPKEVVSVGQEVEATVLAVDHERRRLSLSMAASTDASPDEIAAAPRAPQKLGTFGDLLQRKK